MRTLLMVGMLVGATAWAGPLDPPSKAKATPALAAKPSATPFAPSSTTLSQPDRLRSAADGPGVMTGNPLERGPIANAKLISGTVIQTIPGGSLLFALGKETVMVKGLPANFLVKDGTALKIKVHPTKTLAQYTTVTGALATVDSYVAVEVPKAR